MQKILAFVTFLAFLAAAVAAGGAIYYAGIAKKQLGEMRKTNRLTKQALDNSDKSLASTLLKLQGQVDATNLLAGHAKDQATASQTAAVIADQTLQATKDGFHNEDRAWMGIVKTKPLNYDIAADGSVSFIVDFTLRNYGRSAADHVHFLANLESDPIASDIPCDQAAKSRSGDILLPTQERDINWVLNLTSDKMAKGWTHQNPKLGHTLILKVLGCIVYSDRKGEPVHQTPFAYLVWRKDGYIEMGNVIPVDQLTLEPYGTDSTQTR